MGYRDLIDISLNVDASGLYEKLDERDSQFEGLVHRVQDIENSGYPVDEDKVNDLIASFVADGDYLSTGEAVRLMGREMDNRDYVNESQVDEVVSEKLRDTEYGARLDTVEEMVRLMDEGDNERLAKAYERIESLESQQDEFDNKLNSLPAFKIQDIDARFEQQEVAFERLERRLDNLQGTLHSQVTRIEALEGQVKTLTEDFDVHIKSLEEQVKAQDSAIDSQLARIVDLEANYLEVLNRDETAMTFFQLIKQAFALLQRGA
jgi:hypothetical protein